MLKSLRTPIVTTLTILACTAINPIYAQQERDYISIVGSSTVYPLAAAVIERFKQSGGFPNPQMQSTGTSGGFRLFCDGIGPNTPDLSNASRPIKQSELAKCAENGVTEIIEVQVGHDGVVVVRPPQLNLLDLSREELFLALAKQVPDPNDETTLIDNPYTTWNQINPKLPDTLIEVWTPDTSHGTYDLFISAGIQVGCKKIDALKTLATSEPSTFKDVCTTLREDGAHRMTELSDYRQITELLQEKPHALGVMSYFASLQSPTIKNVSIDGIEANFGLISRKKYPLSRSLLFYVKKAHIDRTPGLRQYLAEFTSESAWGASKGYLFDSGMIPMSFSERSSMKDRVIQLQTMNING